MVDYGTDISTFPFDESFREITGAQVVGEVIARRLMTPTDSIDYAPGAGFDLIGRLNDDLGDAELAQLEQEIRAEAEADERVLAAEVSVVYARAAFKLTVSMRVTLATGDPPFRMTIQAASGGLTVAALEAA